MNRVLPLLLLACTGGKDDHGTAEDVVYITRTVTVTADVDTDSDADADADGDADTDTTPPGLVFLWGDVVVLQDGSAIDFDDLWNVDTMYTLDVRWGQLPDGIGDSGLPTWAIVYGLQGWNGATLGELSYPWGDDVQECASMTGMADVLAEPFDSVIICLHTEEGHVVVFEMVGGFYGTMTIDFSVYGVP